VKIEEASFISALPVQGGQVQACERTGDGVRRRLRRQLRRDGGRPVGGLAGLDQFAALAEQNQPFLVIDADEDQPASGIQHQGFHDLKAALAPLGAQFGEELGGVAAGRPGAEPDQAQHKGQAEDGAGEIKDVHAGDGSGAAGTRDRSGLTL
jgi:hypothetical protein